MKSDLPVSEKEHSAVSIVIIRVELISNSRARRSERSRGLSSKGTVDSEESPPRGRDDLGGGE